MQQIELGRGGREGSSDRACENRVSLEMQERKASKQKDFNLEVMKSAKSLF